MPMHTLDVRSRQAGATLSTIDRLLEVASSKRDARVAWLCPTYAMARNRMREMAAALREAGQVHSVLLAQSTIRLHNGSEIIFPPVSDERGADRLRGLTLAAVAASPREIDPFLVRDIVRALLAHSGGELIR